MIHSQTALCPSAEPKAGTQKSGSPPPRDHRSVRLASGVTELCSRPAQPRLLHSPPPHASTPPHTEAPRQPPSSQLGPKLLRAATRPDGFTLLWRVQGQRGAQRVSDDQCRFTELVFAQKPCLPAVLSGRAIIPPGLGAKSWDLGLMRPVDNVKF